MSAPVVQLIPLSRIDESPNNPRKRFTALDELGASIKDKGVLQPILLRPSPADPAERFELIVGARRVRASRLIEAEDIPAIVRELSDLEVLETMLIENNQREDVHPLEEADGFAQLAREHGKSAEEIAAKLGRSSSYVYSRMKLTELCPAAREAFSEDKITFAIALIVARIPHHELQAKALAEILEPNYDGEPATTIQARNIVRAGFMLRIVDAQFDPAEDVPGLGACSSCPKRTGNQGELFSDYAKEDLCTDPKCFESKRDREWRRRYTKALESGQRVFNETETKTKNIFDQHGGAHLRWDCDFIDVDGTDYDPNTGKEKTWAKILGKKCPPKILARAPDGTIRELIEKKAAAAVLKETKGKVDSSRLRDPDEDHKQQQAKEKFDAAVRTETAARSTVELVHAIEVLGLDAEAWRRLASAVVSIAWSDTTSTVSRRRGLWEKGCDTKGVLWKAIETMSERQAAALVVELACTRDAAQDNTLDDMCELYAVDTAGIKRAVTAALKAKKKTRGAA